jgi:prepilin-type N-terminal cleavage/methylation domain-containing protein
MMPTVEIQNSALARVVTARAFAPTAFTMIELLVVLLIMSIVAAVAAPTFHKSLGHHRLESAARRVKQDLEYLRDTARAKSVTLACEFDDDTNSYTLDDISLRHLDRDQAYEVQLGDEPYQLDAVDSGFGDPEVNRIEFNGFGVPTSGGEIELFLGEKSRVVIVDESSGQISILPEE